MEQVAGPGGAVLQAYVLLPSDASRPNWAPSLPLPSKRLFWMVMYCAARPPGDCVAALT